MKKIIASLALVALAGTAQAGGRDVAAGVILGAIIASQPRVIVQTPPQVVVIPQQIYAPHPVYTQPQFYPVPRVITSSEPCHYYGQMVMTFDQYGRPVGYRNCQ